VTKLLPRDILLEKKRKLHKEYEANFKDLVRTAGFPVEHRIEYLHKERMLQQQSVALVWKIAPHGVRTRRVKGLVMFLDD